MRPARELLIAVGVAWTLGCESQPAPNATARSMPQEGTVAAPLPVASPERPLTQRREAQPLLDSASALLGSGDAVAAAKLLNRAAAFFLVQAHAPPSGGTIDLLQASSALDSLAGDLIRDRSASLARLRRISAHTNLAEAERHGALAAGAWSTRSKESVCDELTMAADHVERAAADADLKPSPAMQKLLAEMRRIVTQLPAQHGIDLQTLDEPLASLHIEIRAMHERLTRADREARGGGVVGHPAVDAH